MVASVKLAADLKLTLQGLVSGSHTRQQINHVVRVAHALSTAFLASKRSSGTLMGLHGINLSDLGYDCIAEIFQQNADGRLIQLEVYFASLQLDECTDEELLAHLRRLVFSKVNHGVFRLYNEADPMLARVLRNTKLAIASLGQFVEVERFGEQCIAPAMCDNLEHLPPLEREQIEQYLMTFSRGNESVPGLLAKVAMCLREQDTRCRVLPVFAVACALRTVYESRGRSSTPRPSTEPDDPMLADDVLRVVNSACKNIRERFEKKYVGRKLQPELFESYMQVIHGSLVDRFVSNDGEETSLYERLEGIVRGLSKEEYGKYHRSRLEYLSREAHDLTVQRLRHEAR